MTDNEKNIRDFCVMLALALVACCAVIWLLFNL
jgi:hypothetical protein